MEDDKKELEEIVDIINLFIDILEQFFSKLINGHISEAKEMQTSLKKSLNSLKTMRIKNTNTLAKQDLVLPLQKEITTSTTILDVIKFKINNLLVGVTDAEFKKDPDTYKALLIDEFSELIKNMKTSLTEIKTKIEVKLKELIPKKNRESFILPDAKIQEEAQYTKFKKKCEPQLLEAINLVEYKIEKNSKTNFLHEEIKTGTWKKYLHARLPGRYGDYRIVYSWNRKDKILTYCIIGRHKDLGIG